jgi:hypothetical protein
VKHDKFHGRIGGGGRGCERPGCHEPGEFRAPGANGEDGPFGEGPGAYRWFCLAHVREFNARYDWFAGMSPEQIVAAQSPIAGWERETRAFRPDAQIDAAPRWADFTDPLDAIQARARARRTAAMGRAEAARRGIGPDEARAFETLGLGFDADRTALRRAYSELVRAYHPDRNGGNRAHEARLQAVVEAYQRLKGSRLFA